LNIKEVYKSPRTEIERAMYNKLSNEHVSKIRGFCEFEIDRATKCLTYGKSLNEYFLPLHTELKLRSNKYELVGVIDRVDRLFNDKIVIFDYKTGSKKPISFWNEIELVIYKLLYEESYPNDNISYTGILYTESILPLQKLNITDSLVQKVIDKVNNIKDCMNMGLFAPAEKPLFSCPCEYSDWCEKFKK